MADAISAVRDLIESNWTKPPKPSIEDIAVLEKELTEAIEAEEYERAAEIRDRIHQLKELAAG